MRKFLEERLGQEIEVICQGASISGKLTKVEENVLRLEKDDVPCYVNIKKIVVVWDVPEKKGRPPGFLTTEE